MTNPIYDQVQISSFASPEQDKRLNFETPPFPGDFDYNYVQVPSDEARISDSFRKRVLEISSLAFCGSRGISIKSHELGFGEEYVEEKGRVPYFLAGPVNVSEGNLCLEGIEAFCQNIRGPAPNARINLVPYYDLNKGLAQSYDPQGFDAENGCNTIFPDDISEGWAHPSLQDLADNVICETLRIKYRPEPDLSHGSNRRLAKAREWIDSDVPEAISKPIRDRGLWHRAPTDGTVMFRIPDKGEWLVSQTKTDKTALKPEDFSLVLNSPSGNHDIVKYAGHRLPSSDTPEYLQLVNRIEHDIERYGHRDALPNKILIHFHHPNMTRSGKFPLNTTDEEIEYGVAESGDKIYESLKKSGSNWIILKNHGILWLGESLAEFEEFLDEIGI